MLVTIILFFKVISTTTHYAILQIGILPFLLSSGSYPQYHPSEGPT